MTARLPRYSATKIEKGTRYTVIASAVAVFRPAYTRPATSTVPMAARMWHHAGLSCFTRRRPHHTATATRTAVTRMAVLDDGQSKTKPSTGHNTMASAKRMRRTDRGLSSSRGAPSANHERVFGNIRLCTDASAESRWLVTAAEAPVFEDAQPRHVGPCVDGAFTSALSAVGVRLLRSLSELPHLRAGEPRAGS